MLIISYLSSSLNYEGDLNWMLSILFLAAGIGLVLWSGLEFRRYRTTVNPMDPTRTTDLVTSGIYKYSRNPMYVGFVLFLLGWASFLGSLISSIVIILFVWYLSKYQIEPEERVLEKKFGSLFTEYKKRVRRWI